ncbi:roundabout homolog 4 isoform X2 [Alligator sinensis]|uniref:Roundabout homolog 4 isoform X2 n=1 Tax=Alligator sinensis TaxID=38654 RepID=A0A1U7S743_ALLSI|nr:roundabout homolog 4 isoform X2 [Alligator sinensis]
MARVWAALQALWLGVAFWQVQGSRSRSEEFAPYITDHPTDLVVQWDQPATLNCRAEGNPKPTIEWYRNGVYVKTNKDELSYQRSLLPGGSLFFYRLNQQKGQSDEGIYSCVAKNYLGVATSKNASLYIAALQDDFQLHPSDLVVAVGEQVRLQCAPPRGHPEPTVSWKKDGVPINQESSHHEISSGRLLVAHAQKSDSGVYVCVAFNQAGKRESKVALVSVLEKPTFTQRPTDVVAKFGSSVQFTCGVHGDPLPKVWWHKEHGKLPVARHEVDEEHTLWIYYVTALDSGRYICTAQNQVGTTLAWASLSVQEPDSADTGQHPCSEKQGYEQVEKMERVQRLPTDMIKGLEGKLHEDKLRGPLDTGQREDVPHELSGIYLHLDNSTVLPASSAVHLHWKVISSSQHPEGFTVLYRSLHPVKMNWAELKVPKEHSIIIPALRRGYKYEFKVRPYTGKVHGLDSNSKQLCIPEEVPSAAPQHVTITRGNDENGTVVISWDPPPHDAHNGIIKGYKVWYLGNETHHHSNSTVDGGTHRLETAVLATGIKYCIKVAAFNGAGIGVPSNSTCSIIEPLLGKMTKAPEVLSFIHILGVVRQPAFIAGMGSVLWIVLMVLAIYLCQHHSRQYNQGQQHVLGRGMYRYGSEDTVIQQRTNTSDSPWLSDTWKSTLYSKNFSTCSSLSSQLLWAETKDRLDFHHSTMSFDHQSHSSQLPLTPDNSSLHKAVYVDLPARDMKTFHCPMLPSLLEPQHRRPTEHWPVPCLNPGLSLESTCVRGAIRKGPWQPVSSVPSHLALQGPWKSCSKWELQQVHSTPLLPSSFSASSSGPDSTDCPSDRGQSLTGKGEDTKVLKTFSSPKLLQHSPLLNMNGMLPLPTVPPVQHSPRDQGSQEECSNSQEDFLSQQPERGSLPSSEDTLGEKLPYYHLSTASPSLSLSEDRDAVLTPDQVAQYLELSEEDECQRPQQESTSSITCALSPPHTYGYICSLLPSDLGDADPADEMEDDPSIEGGDCHTTHFFQRYCQTPSSSPSEAEAEGSLGGSLLNGWGSVSEENFTSTRCSLVSSSDGSFLMDANFAQALTVAVDSFCCGLSQPEAEQAYSDFLPPTSLLDGLLYPPESQEVTARLGAEPLSVWSWTNNWMEDMEAKFAQQAQRKHTTVTAEEGKAVLGTHVSESSSPWEGTVREHQDPSPAACSDMPSNLAMHWKGEKSRVVMLPVDMTQSLVKV